MNRSIFAIRNVLDKLRKASGNRETFSFYWENYVLGQLERVDADTYIVSYPKCGRTWLRVLIQNYLALLNIDREYFHDKGYIKLAGHGIVKFEHDQGNWVPAPPSLNKLRFNVEKYQGKKVIFLVRDPRDVVVSSWYHLKYRERIYMADLSMFIRDDLVGIHKVVAFMNLWLDNQHVPADFLLLRYESLHSDPSGTFSRMLHFMGMDVHPEKLEQAIKRSSFSEMKKMELSGTLREPWMKPGSRSQSSMKVRKGKIGSFREELTPDDIAFLDAIIKRELTQELRTYR